MHLGVTASIIAQGHRLLHWAAMGKRGASSSGDPETAPRLQQAGYRQRLKWQKQTQSSQEPHQGAVCSHSCLATLLIEKWSWGEMSARLLQQIAVAAVEDGCGHGELERIASIGSRGQNPQNCHRDLVDHRLQEPKIGGALSRIMVPLKVPPLRVKSCEQTILLPHALFASLFEHHPGAILERLCGGQYENVAAFWKKWCTTLLWKIIPSKTDQTIAQNVFRSASMATQCPLVGWGSHGRNPWSRTAGVQ